MLVGDMPLNFRESHPLRFSAKGEGFDVLCAGALRRGGRPTSFAFFAKSGDFNVFVPGELV